MKRFAKVLLLSVALVTLGLSCAFAYDFDPEAPRMNLAHTSAALLVDGKADYNPDEAYEPAVRHNAFTKPYNAQFLWLYIDPTNFGENTEGWFEVTPSETIEVLYDGDDAIVDRETFKDAKRFTVWYVDGHYLGDGNGAEAEFQDGAETGFIGQPFSTTVGSDVFEGVFPARLRSTKEQVETLKCVPYVELIAKENDANILKEIKWRFVNPDSPATALARNSNANVNVVTQIAVRTVSDRSTVRNNNMVRFNEGDALEGVADFSDMNVLIADIEWVRPYFRFGDSTGIRAAVDHNWRFYMSKGEKHDPTQPNPVAPTDEEVSAAETAAEGLAEKPTVVVAADRGFIKTGTNVKLDETGIVEATTSSVVSVKQSVSAGGAIVLASGLKLPVNSKSLSGANLPQPADDATIEDVANSYHVYKYFEKGGKMDLLAEFGSKVFGYSKADGITIKPTIVIIDSPAPDGDSSIVKPTFGAGKYGVKLSNDEKHLFIYDGYKNGLASDPISLQKADENTGGGGGSSGCNTGFIALLGLIVLPLVLRKK